MTLWQGRSKGRAAGAAALSEKNIKGANLEIVIPILNKKKQNKISYNNIKKHKECIQKKFTSRNININKIYFRDGGATSMLDPKVKIA